MDRSKKTGKNSFPKKNRNLYDDTDEMTSSKKVSEKQKNKNWKHHLIDRFDDEEKADLPSFDEIKEDDMPFDVGGEEEEDY